MRPILLVLAVLLATTPASGNSQAPTSPEWRGCEAHFGLFAAPPDLVALPAGFSPAGPPIGPFADQPAPSGTVLGVVQDCASLVVDGVDTGPTSQFELLFLVAPPAHLAHPDALFHVVVVSVTASSPHSARLYESWRLGEVRVGEIPHGEVAETPALRAARSDAHDPRFDATLATAATPAGPAAGFVLRAFGVDEHGRITGAADVHVGDAERSGLGWAALSIVPKHGTPLPLAPTGPAQQIEGFDYRSARVAVE